MKWTQTHAPSKDVVGDIAAQLGLTAEAVSRIRGGASEAQQSWAIVAIKLGIVEDRPLAQAIAAHYQLPFAEKIDDVPGWKSVKAPGAAFLRSHWILPLRETPDRLEAVVTDPGDRATERALAFAAAGRRVQMIVAPLSEIESALDRLEEGKESLDLQLSEALPTELPLSDARALRDLAERPPIIRVVDQLLGEAVAARASDIHFEPCKDHLKIRIRVDGALRELRRAPANAAPAIASRIKVLGGMDVANRRAPQDGRATIVVRGRALDLRLATAPGLFGESVAVRLLDRDAVRLDLDDLHFSEAPRTVIENLIARAQGMVLVTGPTGHGKTTTLYAVLNRLNDGARKIITIEDPVEYEIDGVTQVQVNDAAGVSFSEALRAFLRHDPDVILVGEIRDPETAKLAVQAALTGHLVLATMHTIDAPSAIARLREMGIETYLIAATLSGVIAQRLFRRLCRCQPEGAQAAKCTRCGGGGFYGRAVIAEAFEADEAIRRAIASNDANELAPVLKQRGFTRLEQDGERRVAAGETTRTEIQRVIS